MAKKTTASKKKREKPLRYWKAEDFIKESKRLNGDKDSGSDGVVCGAMMLAALREGPGSLKRLSKVVEVDYDRLRPMYDNLRRNKVFGQKKIYCDWFSDDGGISFIADVCVGIGWFERIPEAK